MKFPLVLSLCAWGAEVMASNSIYMEEMRYSCISEKRCEYHQPCTPDTSERLIFVRDEANYEWDDGKVSPLSRGRFPAQIKYLAGPDAPRQTDVVYGSKIRGLNTDQILARTTGKARRNGWSGMLWDDRAYIYHTRTTKISNNNPFKNRLYEVVVFECERLD